MILWTSLCLSDIIFIQHSMSQKLFRQYRNVRTVLEIFLSISISLPTRDKGSSEIRYHGKFALRWKLDGQVIEHFGAPNWLFLSQDSVNEGDFVKVHVLFKMKRSARSYYDHLSLLNWLLRFGYPFLMSIFQFPKIMTDKTTSYHNCGRVVAAE